MRKVLGFLFVGMVLVSGSAFGQGFSGASGEASHDVTVRIPSILRLTMDDDTVLFDFSDANNTEGGVANFNNYLAFLEDATEAQDFNPTSYGDNGSDSIEVKVLSNHNGWQLQVQSVTDFAGDLNPLNNSLKVSATGGDTDISVVDGHAVFTSGGVGMTITNLRYQLTLDPSDHFFTSGDEDTADLEETITVTYQLAHP